jgi:hypothetical protein
MPQNIFYFQFEFAEIFEFDYSSAGYHTPAEQKIIIKIGGSLSMDPISLGYCSLYMQKIFEKCPFKENGKLTKLVV